MPCLKSLEFLEYYLAIRNDNNWKDLVDGGVDKDIIRIPFNLVSSHLNKNNDLYWLSQNN
mgnify:CR=1 FL=1